MAAVSEIVGIVETVLQASSASSPTKVASLLCNGTISVADAVQQNIKTAMMIMPHATGIA